MSRTNLLLFAVAVVCLAACDGPDASFDELVYELTDAYFETCIPTGTTEVRVTREPEGTYMIASTVQELEGDDCNSTQCAVKETRPPRALSTQEIQEVEQKLAAMGAPCAPTGDCDSCPHPIFEVDGELHPMPCCGEEDPYAVGFYALGELLVELAEK